MDRRAFCSTFLLLVLSFPVGVFASGGPIIFKKSKVVVRKANGNRDLVRSRIELHDDQVRVFRLKEASPLHEFNYSDLKGAQYSFSKSPRWKSGAGAAVAVGVFALPIFFMKGKKHWLTLQVEGDYTVLKLDKKIYRELITALEARSGIEVERLGNEGKP